ncbi:MAG: HpcH/HpaI aldolase/citrate lyase family protein [Campylobacterota bacterium]|nr:HpcH/HpaI aldolase/citrate lyase family protein [Campylobacterota bacterium]
MINALELGGTLFVPATHKYLEAIAHGEKFPTLRSVVMDLEDGITEDELQEGMNRIAALLPALRSASLLRFIRPRNVEVLRQILGFESIGKINGFIFPKFGLESAEAYLSLMKNSQHCFMPSIEGKELFDAVSLGVLRDWLLPYNSRIPVIRFGAEDMFRQLGLRRECATSLYDMAAPSQVIGNLLTTFKPYGFALSAPVYRCYKDHEGFINDVKRDLQEGMISKTIIHPDQIDLLEKVYAVSSNEYEAAREIISSGDAVFAQNGEMAERTTQHPWAESILKRAALYGRSNLLP